VASYAVINLVLKIIERKSPSKSIFNVEIIASGRTAKGRGFVDTGNSLREMFSDTPVIVGQRNFLKRVMPDDIDVYFETGDPDMLNEKIRLIPASTAAGSALLPAFRADEVRISRPSEQYIHKNIYVAVSSAVFFGGEFEFLLNSELTEDTEYEKNHTENKAVYK
ncbi:MAG: sigma-E processing peptidase SpoIIGA, partial [Clostridia bacterium]|nr:sigma-E processing peptidase SpoIIGA [Clostridia bacterium]